MKKDEILEILKHDIKVDINSSSSFLNFIIDDIQNYNFEDNKRNLKLLLDTLENINKKIKKILEN
jgi:hypothetical protein